MFLMAVQFLFINIGKHARDSGMQFILQAKCTKGFWESFVGAIERKVDVVFCKDIGRNGLAFSVIQSKGYQFIFYILMILFLNTECRSYWRKKSIVTHLNPLPRLICDAQELKISLSFIA
jgi:hypothetical protein